MDQIKSRPNHIREGKKSSAFLMDPLLYTWFIYIFIYLNKYRTKWSIIYILCTIRKAFTIFFYSLNVFSFLISIPRFAFEDPEPEEYIYPTKQAWKTTSCWNKQTNKGKYNCLYVSIFLIIKSFALLCYAFWFKNNPIPLLLIPSWF